MRHTLITNTPLIECQGVKCNVDQQQKVVVPLRGQLTHVLWNFASNFKHVIGAGASPILKGSTNLCDTIFTHFPLHVLVHAVSANTLLTHLSGK
jgi:hypothetical protein